MPGKNTLIAMAAFIAAARLSADCSPTVVVQVPATACKSGSATATVTGVPGATYAWSVAGGTIVGDASSDRVNLSLGTNTAATVSVTMASGNCVAHGSGVIALHDPFSVRFAAIPTAHAGEPLTISWAYDNGAPARQTLSVDFGTISLGQGDRNYTYTPQSSGSMQAVIDASMDTPGAPQTMPSRQRSVAKSPVSASACAVVHAAQPYTVDLCSRPTVVLDGPTSVATGSTFQLSVRPQPGAVATWTITNGSPATATGDDVTITAGSSGNVGVDVRLTRGACVGQLDRTIAIGAKVCNNPKAEVSAGPIGCGSAIVNATFTGTPPFKGTWSDGSNFNTNAMTLARSVTIPGNYSIESFEDSSCAGTTSGVAVIQAVRPTATVVGKPASCVGTDKVTVQFTGKPPFSGQWSDGTGFLTNEKEIVMPVTSGQNGPVFGYDGTDCRLSILGDVVGLRPIVLRAERFCLSPDFDNVVMVYGTIDYSNGDSDFTQPLTVTWSDGVTVSQNGYPAYRVGVKPDQTTTYTIASAHDANCPAIIGTPSVTVYASPIPDFLLGIGTLNTGVTKSVSLATPPPADATVNWFVNGGTLVSGQGTSSIQYKSDVEGTAIVGCTFTFPDDRCPTSTRRAVAIVGDTDGTLELSKSEAHSGEMILITYTMNTGTINGYLHDSQNQYIPFQGICGPHITCQAQYSSTHLGLNTISLELEGFSGNKKTISAPLTIVP